jgi:hypothetical protein
VLTAGSKDGPPWDEVPGSVTTDIPPQTSANIRRVIIPTGAGPLVAGLLIWIDR